jgi:hypothetical protein
MSGPKKSNKYSQVQGKTSKIPVEPPRKTTHPS